MTRKNSFCDAEPPRDLSIPEEKENFDPKSFDNADSAYGLGLKRDPRLQTMQLTGLKDIELPKGLETTRNRGCDTRRGFETNR